MNENDTHQIACICLALNQQEFMTLLSKQGSFIKQKEFEKAHQVQEQIENKIKERQDFDIQKPYYAFLTF